MRFVLHLPIDSPICPATMQPNIRPTIWIEVKVGLIQDRPHTRSNCGVVKEEFESAARRRNWTVVLLEGIYSMVVNMVEGG